MATGFTDDELGGYFVTEDQGAVVRIFPIQMRLRYLVPFEAPEATIEHLRAVAERAPSSARACSATEIA